MEILKRTVQIERTENSVILNANNEFQVSYNSNGRICLRLYNNSGVGQDILLNLTRKESITLIDFVKTLPTRTESGMPF